MWKSIPSWRQCFWKHFKDLFYSFLLPLSVIPTGCSEVLFNINKGPPFSYQIMSKLLTNRSHSWLAYTCFMQSILLGFFSTFVIFKSGPGDSFETAAKNNYSFEYKTKTSSNYTHSSRVQIQHKLIWSRCLWSKHNLQEEQSPVC